MANLGGFAAAWAVVNGGAALVPVPPGTLRIVFLFLIIPLYLIILAAAACRMDTWVRMNTMRPLAWSAALWAVFGLLIWIVRARPDLPVPILVANLLLLACSSVLGVYLAWSVKRVDELVPICTVMICVDAWTVLKGPARMFAEDVGEYYARGAHGTPPWADMFLVRIVVPGTGSTLPLFGIPDWICLVLLTAALVRLVGSGSIGKGSRSSRVLIALPLSGLIGGIFVAHICDVAIPGMAVMGGVLLVGLLGWIRDLRWFTPRILGYSLVGPMFLLAMKVF
jgi:hypothetical protein